MSLYESGLNRSLEGQDALPDLLLAQATSRKLVRQQTALGFPERDRRFSMQIIKRRGATFDIAGLGMLGNITISLAVSAARGVSKENAIELIDVSIRLLGLCWLTFTFSRGIMPLVTD